MKKKFPGFYQPTNDEINAVWHEESTLFIFDTNTLLNLYGYAETTRNDFFSILEKISAKIWLPYHVVLEYQRRRLSIIKDEKEIFSKAEKHIKKIENIFESDFPQLNLEQRVPGLHKATDKLHSGIKKLIINYKKSLSHWDSQQPCVRSHDHVRKKLTKLFEDKIGPIPNGQKWLDEVYSEGEKRYKLGLPPGFEDKGKSKDTDNEFMYAGLKYKRHFGDLIIWKQILEKAKNQNVSNVIYVTDDAKKDWWYILNSRGKKKIGPRAELREEIANEAGINIFTMYSTSDFLENGNNLLNLKISHESINETKYKFLETHSLNERIRDNLYKDLLSTYSSPITKSYIDSFLKDYDNQTSLGAARKEMLRQILSPSENENLKGLLPSYRAENIKKTLLSSTDEDNYHEFFLSDKEKNFLKILSKKISSNGSSEDFKRLTSNLDSKEAQKLIERIKNLEEKNDD